MTRTDDELERLLRETFADAERQVTEDHPLPATPGRPRQARWLVLAAAAAVAAVPIGVTAVRGLGETPVSGGPSVTVTTSSQANSQVTADAQVYAAVVKEITKLDRPDGGWPVLFVLDAPRVMDAHGTFTDERLTPLTPAVRAGIEEGLGGSAPVRWIRDRSEGTHEDPSCPTALQGGVIVTVGEIRTVGDQLEVRAGSWLACQAAHWDTYKLERAGGAGWKITGSVGPQVIS
jgi:hypothetical protein